ncbi:MAG: hypothetical protein GX891_00780 [Clostridiales bacterium]|nr:hypothetical protein [Clostridiales bacterium]
MEHKFLTPTEMWENFNPVKEPLEESVERLYEKGSLQFTEAFFTSETAEDGKVRVYIKHVKDKNWDGKRPAVLIFPNLGEKSEIDIVLETLVSHGYCAAVVDYAGFIADGKRSTFPKSLFFAEYDNAKNALGYMGVSARETPWFVWAKIARRAITYISSQSCVDADKIGVIGLAHGAQIVWLVSGIDGRIKAAMPIIGCGGTRYEKKPAVKNSLEEQDEERCWISGVGPETYARFVSCPLLYSTTSNSTFADVDKAWDIVSSVPYGKKGLLISPKTNFQIERNNFLAMMTWLDTFINGEGRDLPMPKIKLYVENGKLYLNLDTGEKPKAVEIYCSEGKNPPPTRDWLLLSDELKDNLVYEVDVRENADIIYAFANVTYDDDITLSSAVVSAEPLAMGVKDIHPAVVDTSRIIYSGDMGISAFSIETFALIMDYSALTVKEGPFGIKGVSTTGGYLVTTMLTKSKYAEEKDSILKMDIFSKDPREIRIQLISYKLNKSYTARVVLVGGELWQKVLLTAQDFKSEDGKTLSRFSDMEKAVFKNVANVIINNIIWI